MNCCGTNSSRIPAITKPRTMNGSALVQNAREKEDEVPYVVFHGYPVFGGPGLNLPVRATPNGLPRFIPGTHFRARFRFLQGRLRGRGGGSAAAGRGSTGRRSWRRKRRTLRTTIVPPQPKWTISLVEGSRKPISMLSQAPPSPTNKLRKMLNQNIWRMLRQMLPAVAAGTMSRALMSKRRPSSA